MYVLGIDFGGGAAKATLLRDDGAIVATYTVEYPTLYPAPGRTEQNPEDWYDATRKCIASLLETTRIDPGQIAMVCLDAATHTAVLTDENFNVLQNAIYWTDSRSVDEVAFLKKRYSEIIDKQVLHRADTIWTLPQLLWVKQNQPDIWARTRRIMFAKDYVRHRLTGDYVTDTIEAQGSMFFNSSTMDWSPELCDILELDIKSLPRLVRPDEVVGQVLPEAAAQTGLKPCTPVLCGTTDTVMEVFASGAIRLGQMTIKLATAGRICVITEKACPSPWLINYSHIVPGLWYPGTATKSCAASYRWFRDVFGGDYQELDNLASQVVPGCEGIMFHPYLNGELTPYADPLLCGSFIGIRANFGKGHFARAVLEGVALSMLDCLDSLEHLAIEHENHATIIGGGGASPLWRQILADTLQLELVQNERSDSSFGSAMLAGIAAGMFDSPEQAVSICTRSVSRTQPNADMSRFYRDLFEKYKTIHDALAPVYH